jgi:hypothetical protein
MPGGRSWIWVTEMGSWELNEFLQLQWQHELLVSQSNKNLLALLRDIFLKLQRMHLNRDKKESETCD